MSDRKMMSCGSDRQRINVNEPYELRNWSHRFDFTMDRLQEAVTAVGPMVDDGERYLKAES